MGYNYNTLMHFGVYLKTVCEEYRLCWKQLAFHFAVFLVLPRMEYEFLSFYQCKEIFAQQPLWTSLDTCTSLQQISEKGRWKNIQPYFIFTSCHVKYYFIIVSNG